LAHISFSELKTWDECPFKRKLTYQDKIKLFTSNEYTIFGTSMHETCEKSMLGKIKEEDCSDYFETNFKDAIEKVKTEIVLNETLVKDMVTQGKDIFKDLFAAIKEYLGEYEVIACEEQLMESIDDCQDYNFKGFIDLILKTSDGKYHIIDHKSCGWGWDMKKKTHPMTTYQLTLYKKFYSKKLNIPLDLIETHFCLLKRTAKKNRVELFRVTSGDKKMENANLLLTKAVSAIKSNKHIKNRLSCEKCEFHKTKHCP